MFNSKRWIYISLIGLVLLWIGLAVCRNHTPQSFVSTFSTEFLGKHQPLSQKNHSEKVANMLEQENVVFSDKWRMVINTIGIFDYPESIFPKLSENSPWKYYISVNLPLKLKVFYCLFTLRGPPMTA